jgi:predicted nucleic acid-binding protein
MISLSKIIAILDANALYPAPLRDFLLQLANVELYKPKWTEEIQQEWVRNLLLKRTDLKRANLEKTCEAMDSAFPEANIANYAELINSLSLPDNNDRHVLAAAISVRADLIVTFNLKDFPIDYLKSFRIKAQSPDDFIMGLINRDKPGVELAFNNQVRSLKNPAQSKEQVLNSLAKCGLKNSLEKLKN